MCRLFATGFVVTLLALLMLQTTFPAGAPQEHEITYDSGTPGGSVSLPYSPHEWAGGQEEVNMRYVWLGNSMLAVRFTPDNGTVQMLVGVRFYITKDVEDFRVWLLDSNMQFLTYPKKFGPAAGSEIVSAVYSWDATPASIGWVNLNVTDELNPVFVADDFYVAIEFTLDHKPSLGVDTIGQRSNRGWFLENQSINGSIEYSAYARQHGLPDGNLMIRAVTMPLPKVAAKTTTNTTTTTKSTPGEWVFPTAIAFAVLIVAAVGARKVAKRRQVQ